MFFKNTHQFLLYMRLVLGPGDSEAVWGIPSSGKLRRHESGRVNWVSGVGGWPEMLHPSQLLKPRGL
jgi:hypothetical protein